MSPILGLRVVEDPRMMPGAYFFKDHLGRILATGHINMGFLPHEDTKGTTQIVCSTAAYEAIKEKVKSA